jgi:uncharacterized glyoxalase superfamily protein PhnB
MPESTRNPNSVHLTVTHVGRSLDFYCKKLGFKLKECFPDKKKPVWASLQLDGQVVMLGLLPSLEEAKRWGMGKAEIELLKQDARAFARGAPGIGVLYYVCVADVDAYCRRVKRKRVRPMTPVKSQFYGIRDFQVADPDGYRLVFYSALPEAAPGTRPEA